MFYFRKSYCSCDLFSVTSAVTSSTQTSELWYEFNNTLLEHEGWFVLCLMLLFSVFSVSGVCAGLESPADGSVGSVRSFSHLHETHVR